MPSVGRALRGGAVYHWEPNLLDAVAVKLASNRHITLCQISAPSICHCVKGQTYIG